MYAQRDSPRPEGLCRLSNLAHRASVCIVLSSGQLGVYSGTDDVVPREAATTLQPVCGCTVFALVSLTRTWTYKEVCGVDYNDSRTFIITAAERIKEEKVHV